MLGRALRRLRAARLHVTLFALYGFTFGVIASWLLGLLVTNAAAADAGQPFWFILALSPFSAVSATALALGRHRAIRRLTAPATPPRTQASRTVGESTENRVGDDVDERRRKGRGTPEP